MLRSVQKGENSGASKELKDKAKSISKKDTKGFAATKHKGLPEHVRKKRKKKKSKKKANLVQYFIKLANLLDYKNLSDAADLTDRIIQKLSQDLLAGGLADNIPDSEFDSKELKTGTDEESEEHTDNPEIAKEIAEDHLMNDPHYYSEESESSSEDF